MSSGIEAYVSAEMKRRILRGETPQWVLRHKRCAYIRDSYLAAPLWMRRSDLRDLRKQAIALTESTGIKHVLDHIIPVSHPYVCGLTVPWNMQVITRPANSTKNNHWHPDQLKLI